MQIDDEVFSQLLSERYKEGYNNGQDDGAGDGYRDAMAIQGSYQKELEQQLEDVYKICGTALKRFLKYHYGNDITPEQCRTRILTWQPKMDDIVDLYRLFDES